MAGLRIPTSLLLVLIFMSGLSHSDVYYGSSLGTFSSESAGVKGELFAVNDHTLFIKGFGCGGFCEGVVFWAGTSENPESDGFIIPSDISQYLSLPPYVKQDVMLFLPKDKDMKNIRWFAVKNKNSTKSLGTLMLSNTLQPPHPTFIGSLVNTKRGVSTGDILVVDTQTIVVPEFSFNGLEKETYWWLSKGTRPSDNGIRLFENESEENNTLVITLPKEHHLYDYDTLSVWSKSEEENLGFVDIPKNLNIPPSPRNLGKEEMKMGEFNCEMLNDNLGLEVRWLIKGDDIIIHLVGNIGISEYMAIGLSKDDAEIRFDTADAVVAGIGADGKKFALDYFFESNKYEKGRRMCPDTTYGKTNDVELLHGERRGSSAMVIFKRPLRADDKIYDQNIYTDGPQSILWAVGQLLEDGCADTPTLQSRGSLLLDFGREPNWNCPPPITAGPPTYSEEKSHYIHCPSNQNFRAQLGSSSSNDRKIWFMNGLPIPEITVQRGNTYTFIVEGGMNPPLHHPLYITESKEGGLYRKILDEVESQEVTYAGIDEDPVNGTIFPTAEGRLCDWSYADKNPEYFVETENADTKAALTLRCEPGQPGRLIWIPSALTPDTVYYQSFMEKGLGGKIHVVDFCEESNPNRYLEFKPKEEKSNDNQYNLKDGEIERESEADSFFHFSNKDNEEKIKVEVFNESDEKEELDENILTEIIPESITPMIEINPLDNAINTLSKSSNNFNEEKNSTDSHIMESTTTSSQISITSEEIFPHDESERSDVYLAQQSDTSKAVDVDETSLNSRKNKADQLNKPSSFSDSDVVSSSASARVPTQEFKPIFEGGFMPLVMNPMKEKEFELKRSIDFIQYQSRPHKPFLYNESVPFHESFKPGVPDFSGFNISNYSQEDDSVMIPNQQDNLQFLSASKPQLTYKPFPQANPLPAHLLHLNNEPLRESERPQNVGPRIRLQNPSMVGMHKNLFQSPPLHTRPGFPFVNMKDEDLSLVSSQRVYSVLQAASDKKPNPVPVQHLEIPNIRNRKPSNLQQNKVRYPSPFQRRPDFYEQKENIPNSNAPQRNFNIPRIPPNLNKHIFQNANTPGLQSNGRPRQVNTRSPGRNQNPPPSGTFPGNIDQVMIPPGQKRHPRPVTQAQANKRLPFTNQQKEIPLVPEPPKGERLFNGVSNPSQVMGGRVPFPIHMINPNIKVSLESPKPVFSYDSDISSSKELEYLQSALNAENAEMSNFKNIQQNFPARNPSGLIQNLPALGPLHTLNMHTKVRNPELIPSIPQPQHNRQRTAPGMASPPKSLNVSENLKPPSQEIKNNPAVSEIYETFIQNAGINPSIISDHSFEIDTSDRSDAIAETTEFKNLDVPFGARLKFPQNKSEIPLRLFKQHPRIPITVIRRPQTTSKNSQKSESKPTELQIAEGFSHNPNTITAVATLIAQQNTTNINVDSIQKHLNETLQYQSLNAINSSNTFNKDNILSKDANLVPIIIETSKDTFNKQHLGRKSSFILNSNSSHPSILVPLRTLDNVNLPQISENPPTPDNKTDYSILNHILTLIGGPSEQNEPFTQ